MTEQDSGRIPEFEPLLDNAIVYRALLRKRWIDRENLIVNYDAYLLRENENGLSVRIASACSPEECAARFRNCYGVASLQVGLIRQLGLDVILDSPSHGNIVGLPNAKDDPTLSERLADLLAQQSIIVWQP